MKSFVEGFIEGIISGFLTVALWMTRSARERHDLIAGLLEYVMSSTKIWWAVLAAGACSYFLMYSETDRLFAAFFAAAFTGVSIIMRFTSHQFGISSFPVTVVVWEFNVWFYVLLTITSIPDTREKFAWSLGKVFVWICLSYVVTDLGTPPRKRKKIKIKKAAPVAQKEFSL